MSTDYRSNTITLQVTGPGEVTGASGALDCGAGSTMCKVTLSTLTQINLSSRAGYGYVLTGWGGDCSGTAPTCSFDNSKPRTVTATYGRPGSTPPVTPPPTPPTTPPPAPTQYLLSVNSAAGGSVSSSPAGISCGGSATQCSATYVSGTAVSLTATAASGYTFSGWSGGNCSGTGGCTVTVSASTTVSAGFTATPATPPVTPPSTPPTSPPTTTPSTPAVGVGSGKTYYVSASGSDSASGSSLTAPFRTMSKAVSLASAGDIVEVRAGTYSENVIIRRPGSASAWITLRGYNGERPVLKSTTSLPTLWFYTDKCDEDNLVDPTGNNDCQPMYWVIQGLEIQGSPSGNEDGNAIKVDTPKVKLIGNRLCCSVADVVKLVRTSNDVEVLNNEIWQDPKIVTPSSNAQGVDIVGADRAHVGGNYVHDINDIGIYAKGNSRNALFENNRLVNIGVHALMLGQSTDADRLTDGNYETYDGVVRNNVVVGTGWACLATSSSYNARFYNNSCYDTGKLVHGSILLSNESEVGQAGTNLYFANNIIYGSANRPVFKIGSNSMTDYKTLYVDHNVYFVPGGNPTFTSSDYFDPVPFSQWLTKFKSLTGHDDTSSKVADPLYSTTTGTTPLTLNSGSPAINAGVNLSTVPSDVRGVARPKSGATDIGAYEY